MRQSRKELEAEVKVFSEAHSEALRVLDLERDSHRQFREDTLTQTIELRDLAADAIEEADAKLNDRQVGLRIQALGLAVAAVGVGQPSHKYAEAAEYAYRYITQEEK